MLFFNYVSFQLMSLGHCWWTRKTDFLHGILKPFFMQILRKKKNCFVLQQCSLVTWWETINLRWNAHQRNALFNEGQTFSTKMCAVQHLHNKFDMVAHVFLSLKNSRHVCLDFEVILTVIISVFYNNKSMYTDEVTCILLGFNTQ